MKKFPRPIEFYHSNYYSKIDSENCDACWQCIEICPMEALSSDGDYSSVDIDRCIGCGVCVSTCPSDAIELNEKDKKYVPPKDQEAMYQKILMERIGVGGMLKTIPKIILRQKI